MTDDSIIFADRVGDAGDHYIGLDRFGRVVDHRWLASDGTDLDRFCYGYDANSNRLYKENLLDATDAKLYSERSHQLAQLPA